MGRKERKVEKHFLTLLHGLINYNDHELILYYKYSLKKIAEGEFGHEGAGQGNYSGVRGCNGTVLCLYYSDHQVTPCTCQNHRNHTKEGILLCFS